MLSEEEKKAIEIVKKIKNMKFKVTSSFYSSGTISLSIEEREAINTVLNLITKLQKENEKYKYLYQKALDNTIKSDRENIELKKENEELKATINKQSLDISNNLLELKQKDKQIDLMAEFIEKVTVDMKIAFGENMLWDRREIKQYFAGLVEKE